MANEKKEVYFDQYCKKCKNQKVDISGNVPEVIRENDWKNKPGFFHDEDTGAVCHDCLDSSYNWDSHKPVNFEEKEE